MEGNPWVGKNYIPDTNFAEVPPPFFLARIWDQDSMLVILPSRKTPAAYVIARRKQWGPGLTAEGIDAQFANPDTKMCVQHGCVPVCLMFKSGPTWDIDAIIRTLQARDLWTHGGADAVADMLEAQEEADRAKVKAATRDDIFNRSGDAWRSYQHRTGQTTIRSKDFHTLSPQPGAADDQIAPSGSMAGSGITLTD